MSEQINEKKHDLLERFIHIQWLFIRHHHHSHRLHGPTGNPYSGQGRVLKLLKMQPEISQKDLSELLDMRPQSLGELLSKLERNGYITRTASESDKRVMTVRLTEKGAEAGNPDERQPDDGDLFDCLSEEEQDNLSEYLDRIINEFEKRFGYERDWPGHHRHGARPDGCGFGREHRHGR
jgi:DNA-binding MarR family transcriptional regulator